MYILPGLRRIQQLDMSMARRSTKTDTNANNSNQRMVDKGRDMNVYLQKGSLRSDLNKQNDGMQYAIVLLFEMRTMSDLGDKMLE